MKLKLLIALAASLAVSVEGVPLNSSRLSHAANRLDKSTKVIESPVPFLDTKLGIFVADDDEISYRLPNNSMPIRYDLFLKTEVDKEIFDFTGRVKIHIKILEATDVITLHGRLIDLQNVDLLNVDQIVERSSLSHGYDTRLEHFHISLGSERLPNEEIILDISYTGELRIDQGGFYRASYQNALGQTVWFATTQFESTDARHAMPCFDEPGIRAVIGVKIQHGDRYDAISNMPVTSRLAVEGTADNVITSKLGSMKS